MFIFPADARALAAALRSACGAPAPLAALPGEAAGDETTPQSGTPLLTAFRTPDDMRALATSRTSAGGAGSGCCGLPTLAVERAPLRRARYGDWLCGR